MAEKKEKKPALRGKRRAAPSGKPRAPRRSRARAEARKTSPEPRPSGPAERPPREAEVRPRLAPATGVHDLRPASGATHSRKRVGRGPGSGHGKTAGRGNKGQKSRSGYRHQRGFEGGQMPLHRRVPKRGFTNIFRVEYDIVNLADLDRFEAGETVNPESLRLRRSSGRRRPVKILGKGELGKPLRVSAHKFSASAKARIEAAGGSCEVIPR